MARLERKPAERVARLGLIVQLVTGVLAVYFRMLSEASTAWVYCFQALIGVLVWIITLIHLRQSRMAEEEQEDWERLQAERAAGGARGQLFEQDEILAFSARNRLRIIEKYIAPTFALVTAVLMALVVGVGLLARGVFAPDVVVSQGVLISTFAFGAAAFVLFLIATYASGMSRQPEWRALRAGASYMMFSALYALLAAAALALGYVHFPGWDDILAYVMLAGMAVVGVEIFLNFVLDFYRPRVEGVESRAAYDSRLLGLLAQPGGVFKTVSATLDYQFGFKVSQTWFYRFIEQAIAPLILFQILTLYLLSCVVIVGPEQKGVVERFGRFSEARDVLEPGAYLKWPWPFERVYRFPANEVKEIHLGHAGEPAAGQDELWTVAHYKEEYNVMVAAPQTDRFESTREAVAGEDRGAKDVPVNLLVATTTVRYKIKDVKDWYYKAVQPEELLEAVCEREQIKYMAGVDLLNVMGPGRAQASVDLRDRMQTAADGLKLGVQIIGVGVEGIHPPVAEDVPRAFHEVVNAYTDKDVKVLTAQTDALRTLGEAQAEATRTMLLARGDYATRVNLAKAETERFMKIQKEAYAVAPEVYKSREFMSALEKGLENPRKIVIGVKGLNSEHVRLNLEDASLPDITSIPKFESEQKPEPKK